MRVSLFLLVVSAAAVLVAGGNRRAVIRNVRSVLVARGRPHDTLRTPGTSRRNGSRSTWERSRPSARSTWA